MKALFGVVAALAAALTACGGSDSDAPATPTDRTPATLVAVAGDVQRGPLNTALPVPLAVQVRNATGRTLQGVPVAWEVTAGGGTLSAGTTSTDVNGVATAGWTLGATTGIQLATASVAGLLDVRFQATALEPPGLLLVSGDGQTVEAGGMFPLPLISLVHDSNGAAVAGVKVRYTGPGTATMWGGTDWPPASDVQGKVQLRWTAPSTPGPLRVVARVEGRTDVRPDSVVFSLQVTAPLVITPGDMTLLVGDTVRLSAKSGISTIPVSWASDDSAIASVSAGGLLRARAPGTTRITASAAQFSTASMTVTVSRPAGSGASLRYFRASDFTNGSLVLDLPASAASKSVLVMIPDRSALDWRRTGFSDTPLQISVKVESGSATDASPGGRALPAGALLAPATWTAPKQAAERPIPDRQAFHVYSPSRKAYLQVVGKRVLTGSHFVFYEDTTNVQSFTVAEYVVIDSVVSANYDALTRIFGEPTDLDGNRRVVLLLSRTAAVERAGYGEAYVDACDLGGSGCAESGETVYFWSLDGLASYGSRDYLVHDYVPRNILHETTHILQYAHGFRRSGSFASFSVPAFYYEGQAETMRLVTGIGYDETWSLIGAKLATSTPFEQPYSLGALVNWYACLHFGEGVAQKLIDAYYTWVAGTRDPYEIAVDVPEPLVLAMLYASLYFDDTAFGKSSGLELPGQHVAARLRGGVPVRRLSVGGQDLAAQTYTGGLIYEISHVGAIRVTIQAGGSGATVIAAQPGTSP